MHRADFHASVAAVAEAVLQIVRLQFPDAQDCSKPDHAPEFRGDQQGMSADGSQACGLGGVFQGNHGAPAPGIFIPLALVGGNGDAYRPALLHLYAEVQGYGVHLRCDGITHSCVRHMGCALQGPCRESAAEGDHGSALGEDIPGMVSFGRVLKSVQTGDSAQVRSQGEHDFLYFFTVYHSI